MRTPNRICNALTFTILLTSLASQASAETLFHDSFGDGDAEDGMPVTWTSLSADMSVQNGSLVLNIPVSGNSGTLAHAEARDFPLKDMSIRTQFRMLEPGRIGFGGGNGLNGRALFRIFTDGRAGLSNNALVQTGFDPLNEDLVAQLDVFGGIAKTWVWRPGEPMPTEPLATRDIGVARSSQPPALSHYAEPNTASSGAFRWVVVADSHIPEPSSHLMAMLGMAGTCCFRRRR